MLAGDLSEDSKLKGQILFEGTLPETNIAPENWRLEY